METESSTLEFNLIFFTSRFLISMYIWITFRHPASGLNEYIIEWERNIL